MNRYLNDKSAVVLANGLFPTSEIPLLALRNAKNIICCDGAVNKLVKIGIEPSVIIGDLDSISEELRIMYKDIICHISSQETNDLTKAIEWCKDKGLKDITIIGATGERDDHSIANIFLLLHYKKKMRVRMLTDHGEFLPVYRSKNFDSYPGQQVSVFSVNPETKITTANLRYPLDNQNLPMLWQGTLNESMGRSFRLDFDPGPLVVFLKY